jgi:hypothetical protein
LAAFAGSYQFPNLRHNSFSRFFTILYASADVCTLSLERRLAVSATSTAPLPDFGRKFPACFLGSVVDDFPAGVVLASGVL